MNGRNVHAAWNGGNGAPVGTIPSTTHSPASTTAHLSNGPRGVHIINARRRRVWNIQVSRRQINPGEAEINEGGGRGGGGGRGPVKSPPPGDRRRAKRDEDGENKSQRLS